MKNILTLRKCAYIFDSTHNNYFYGTREQHKKRQATQKILMEYYDSEQKRLEEFPYTVNQYSGQKVITINGEPHILNDLQIAHIDGEPDSVINHRKEINAAAIVDNIPGFRLWCKNDLMHKDYKTLYFEFFTGIDDLGYIRVHFRNNYERFIIDSRNGELYTSGEHGTHTPTTAKAICNKLEITSEKAKKAFYSVINAITETEDNKQ